MADGIDRSTAGEAAGTSAVFKPAGWVQTHLPAWALRALEEPMHSASTPGTFNNKRKRASEEEASPMRAELPTRPPIVDVQDDSSSIDLRSSGSSAGGLTPRAPAAAVATTVDVPARDRLRTTLARYGIDAPESLDIVLPDDSGRRQEMNVVRMANTIAVLKLTTDWMPRRRMIEMLGALNRALPNRPFFTSNGVVRECLAEARARAAAERAAPGAPAGVLGRPE